MENNTNDNIVLDEFGEGHGFMVDDMPEDEYSLSLDSKKVLNAIAVDLKENTEMDNASEVIDKLEHIALVSNTDIVSYSISLYDDITLLYELFPDIEDHYDYKEKMQVVLDEYNLTIRLISDDRLEEFVNATERKSSNIVLEKYIDIQRELQIKAKNDIDFKFVMPKYYTINVDYFDKDGTVYSQVMVFNRVINPLQDIEIVGVLKYLIDNKVIDSLDQYPLLTVELQKVDIAKIAEIYQEFMMQIDKPIISALQALNLGYQDKFAIYNVKYSINLVFDETVKADTIEMAYTQMYCKLFEEKLDKTITYSESINVEDIESILPSVSWAHYGQHGRLIPYRKEELSFNRAILVANSTFPDIISNSKLPPERDILKTLSE